MTTQALYTADEPNWAGRITISNTARWTRSNTQARTGTYSYATSTGSVTASFARNASATTCYARAALYSAAPNDLSIIFREGTTEHVTILFSSGTITVKRSTTVLATLTSGYSSNTWICYEFYVSINDSTGAVTVKANGVQDATTVSSADTKNGGTTGQIDNLYFSVGGSTWYIDDICIADDWPGTHGNYTLWPTGAGSNSGWTASAGNAYECVDADADGIGDFTDYISDDTTSDKHDFAMGDLAFTPISLGAVQICAAIKCPSGASVARIYADSGGTISNGDDTAISSTATNLIKLLTVDPDTSSAWTESGVNGLVVGVESRS